MGPFASSRRKNRDMSNALPLFPDENVPLDATRPSDKTIGESQRSALRALFEQLGVSDAKGQFQVVEEVTGQRIRSVNELLASNAQVLIHQLPARILNRGKKNTGNAWADRDEDTWIDNL